MVSGECECGSKRRPFPLYNSAQSCVAWACEHCLRKVLNAHPHVLLYPKIGLPDGVEWHNVPKEASPLYKPVGYKGTRSLENNDVVIGVGARRKLPLRDE